MSRSSDCRDVGMTCYTGNAWKKGKSGTEHERPRQYLFGCQGSIPTVEENLVGLSLHDHFKVMRPISYLAVLCYLNTSAAKPT